MENDALDNIVISIPKNSDNRGDAVKVLSTEKIGWAARDIIVLSINPGTSRGNHYHKTKEEIIVVISGTIMIKLTDVRTGKKKELILEGENKKTLFIHPYVLHTLENIGKETAWIIDVHSIDYDKSDDYLP